ncbi:glycosyltransferase family 2 protein [Chloroflexota bacterium]
MPKRLSPEIPVDDAEAALRFCRSLAQALDGQEEGRDSVTLPAPGEALADTPGPELSVVLPICNEEENIPLLHRRLSAVLDGEGVSYDLVFVDDGSTDGSSALLCELAAEDSRTTLVELARNFGHQVAISAGLDFARGEAVIIMDADLQDPPEVLPQFIAKWREGYDVVYAIREQRQESWPKRVAYAAFYRMLRRATHVDIPLDAGDFCIMDREVVDLLRSMPERNRFVRGIRSWVGLRQIGLPYQRDARRAGRSKYTFGRLLLLALDGFISFSHAPLRVASLLGIGISALSLLLATFYFVKRVTTGLSPPGFATLVVAVFFLAGVQLVTLGVIGEYVGRIFDEVKQRPLYVVRQVIRGRS